MSLTVQPMATRRLAGGLLIAVWLGGCSAPSTLDKVDNNRAGMVAAGKAAGAVRSGLPSDCVRTYLASGGDWGTIDEPAENGNDERCTPFSRRGMLIFHKARGRWRLVAVRRTYGHYGDCAVKGVPRSIARQLPLC